MHLELRDLWSPDLYPTDGLPDDLTRFDVLVTAGIAEPEAPADHTQTFYLTVCSPDVLAERAPGSFVTETLVLDRFEWAAVRTRLENLLRHTEGSQTWAEAISELSGYLRYGN